MILWSCPSLLSYASQYCRTQGSATSVSRTLKQASHHSSPAGEGCWERCMVMCCRAGKAPRQGHRALLVRARWPSPASCWALAALMGDVLQCRETQVLVSAGLTARLEGALRAPCSGLL